MNFSQTDHGRYTAYGWSKLFKRWYLIGLGSKHLIGVHFTTFSMPLRYIKYIMIVHVGIFVIYALNVTIIIIIINNGEYVPREIVVRHERICFSLFPLLYHSYHCPTFLYVIYTQMTFFELCHKFIIVNGIEMFRNMNPW